MNENHVCEFHENIHIISILTKLFSNEKIDHLTLHQELLAIQKVQIEMLSDVL